MSVVRGSGTLDSLINNKIPVVAFQPTSLAHGLLVSVTVTWWCSVDKFCGQFYKIKWFCSDLRIVLFIDLPIFVDIPDYVNKTQTSELNTPRLIIS